jgi:Domain of unknown function (DUF4133)
VYVRFGGEFLETYYSNIVRRRVLSLRLKAQYIWYLGGGLVLLLMLFAILYISGVNTFLCVGLIALLGTGLFIWVYHLSGTYGAYGLMKKVARKAVPPVLRSYSRNIFLKK